MPDKKKKENDNLAFSRETIDKMSLILKIIIYVIIIAIIIKTSFTGEQKAVFLIAIVGALVVTIIEYFVDPIEKIKEKFK